MQNPSRNENNTRPITDDSGQDVDEQSSKTQEESNQNDDAGRDDIPKWPFGQDEALKDTDQQKEAVEEYITPKGNSLGSE